MSMWQTPLLKMTDFFLKTTFKITGNIIWVAGHQTAKQP